MINLISTNQDNVVGFSIKDKVDTEDLDRVATVIEDLLKTHDKLKIYAEVESIERITIPAFIQDIKFSLKHFNDFEKEAIVSNTFWLEKLAKFSDRLFPSIEVKHFSFAQKDQALEWISC